MIKIYFTKYIIFKYSVVSRKKGEKGVMKAIRKVKFFKQFEYIRIHMKITGWSKLK